MTFRSEMLSDDDEDGDEDMSDEDFSDDDSEEDQPVQNDADERDAAVQAAMDKLVPGLESSEYGKMPSSFHSNSQRVTSVTMETDERELPPSSDQNSGSEQVPRTRPIRAPILPRDRYEGVDSDDETDEEYDAAEDEEDEEDKPQVVGEIEIDMAQEQDEFLEFARQALGMSDEQWDDILQERRDRGGKSCIVWVFGHRPI